MVSAACLGGAPCLQDGGHLRELPPPHPLPLLRPRLGRPRCGRARRGGRDLGSGPVRIGRGVEFDYSRVHASFAPPVGRRLLQTIMINCNLETGVDRLTRATGPILPEPPTPE
jgi:hypothetical protein